MNIKWNSVVGAIFIILALELLAYVLCDYFFPATRNLGSQLLKKSWGADFNMRLFKILNLILTALIFTTLGIKILRKK